MFLIFYAAKDIRESRPGPGCCWYFERLYPSFYDKTESGECSDVHLSLQTPAAGNWCCAAGFTSITIPVVPRAKAGQPISRRVLQVVMCPSLPSLYFGPGVAHLVSGVWWLCAFRPLKPAPGLLLRKTFYYDFTTSTTSAMLAQLVFIQTVHLTISLSILHTLFEHLLRQW